jgi:hypothetical protein
MQFNLILGVVWAKYGLWTSKTLSPEDNLQRGQWIIFGAWPETLKRISHFVWDSFKVTKKKDGVSKTWDEPYHLGRGSGRYIVANSGVI